MVRSKYIADQAVETARLCVLKASEAEREAIEAKQEAEQAIINTNSAVQAAIDTARAGYKAAYAGQVVTVMGQQAAVWEDPNLPLQNIMRQLCYVTSLINNVMDKANEVTYKAVQLVPELSEEDPLTWETTKRAGRQTALRRQVNISVRKLVNILMNEDKYEEQKNKAKEEAENIVRLVFDAEEHLMTTTVYASRCTNAPNRTEFPLYAMVNLADLLVALANFVCALIAWRISRVCLLKVNSRNGDIDRDRLLQEPTSQCVTDIISYAASVAKTILRYTEDIAASDSGISDVDYVQPVLDKKQQVDLLFQKIQDESVPQRIDELIAQITQAIDIATSQADESMHNNFTYLNRKKRHKEEYRNFNNRCQQKMFFTGQIYQIFLDDQPSFKNTAYARAEDLMDQISTLASRIAILSYQERISIWGEHSETEEDNLQALGAVAQQAHDVANDASQAAQRAFQAANRAGQAVITLIHNLDKPYQIKHLAAQAYTWRFLPFQAKDNIKRSHNEIGSSIEDVERVCQKADTACKDAKNVYEKIEEERRDAEQACKRGIIAAQSVSWWPIWPWSKVWPLGAKLQWFEPSESFKQSEQALKHVSEAVDHVGHATVLVGQAVAQSGQGVTQASQATAIVGKIVTQCPDCIFARLSMNRSEWEGIPETLSSIDRTAQQVADSVARAAQTAAQAGQAANRVAEAAQTAHKVVNIAQAVQQVEWLRKGRQKWIFWLGVLLLLGSVGSLLVNWFIALVSIAAIVDSYLLFTCLIENIRKTTRVPHRIAMLICCALLILLPVYTIFCVFASWIFRYPLNPALKNAASVSTVFLIIFPLVITGIVYYQHCTLNNLHPYDVPTSTLES